MICSKSVIFSIDASKFNSLTAICVCFSSFIQLGHPEPKILIFISILLLYIINSNKLNK